MIPGAMAVIVAQNSLHASSPARLPPYVTKHTHLWNQRHVALINVIQYLTCETEIKRGTNRSVRRHSWSKVPISLIQLIQTVCSLSVTLKEFNIRQRYDILSHNISRHQLNWARVLTVNYQTYAVNTKAKRTVLQLPAVPYRATVSTMNWQTARGYAFYNVRLFNVALRLLPFLVTEETDSVTLLSSLTNQQFIGLVNQLRNLAIPFPETDSRSLRKHFYFLKPSAYVSCS
jgi:hypothetical protein